MYGILASQLRVGGKPLLLTVVEDDGSGGVLRAYPADPRYKAGQRWKRVLGCGRYRSRNGLFRFGYAYVTEALGRPQVLTAVSGPEGQLGGVVRTWFTTESGRYLPESLWGIRMPDEETRVAELIAVQSTDGTLYVLDITNGDEGGEVITWPSHGGDNQRWVFITE